MTPQGNASDSISPLTVLRRYMVVLVLLNLVWEFAHMPLYTIWEEGTIEEILFAAVHCTGGDALIGLTAIMLAAFLFGGTHWPYERMRTVLFAAIGIGIGYTIFSEWLNIVVRQAWAYRDIMPVIPMFNVGLSPLLQWIVIPVLAYVIALKPVRHRRTQHA
ncbi:MAG: hypothetical protein RH946_17410 [Rhodospirillales bacterium]